VAPRFIGAKVENARVIVVDKDRDHRAHCASILETAGYHVVTAGRRTEVEVALSKGALAAALVDDDGAEVARMLRDAGVPMFGMSSVFRGETNRSLAMLREGYADYWEKPVRADEVASWLRRVVGDQTRSTVESSPDPSMLAQVAQRVQRATAPVEVVAARRRLEDTPVASSARPVSSRRTPQVTGTPLGSQSVEDQRATGGLAAVPSVSRRPADISGDVTHIPFSDPPARTSVRMPQVPVAASREEPQVPAYLDVLRLPDDQEVVGDFTETAFPTLLAALAYKQRSGRLMLQRGDDKRLIYFDRGFAVSSKTSQDGNQSLTEMIVAHGLMSARDMAGIEAHAARGRQDVRDVLVQRRAFTEDEVDHLTSVHLRNKVVEVFAWEDGTFTFTDGPVPRAHRKPPVINPMELIWEGIQHGTPLSLIRRYLDPNLGSRMVWMNDPLEQGDLHLVRSQERFLARIDGRSSLHDLSRAGLVTEDAQRLLYVLVATGLIGFVG